MKLHFDQIGGQGYHVSLEGKTLSLEEDGKEVLLGGHVAFSRKKGTDSVVVRGEIRCRGIGQCSFCAADTPYSFEEGFVYRLLVGIEPPADESDVQCREEDMERLYLQEPRIDLDEILREQIYLNLPLQLSCRPACKGLCPICGANRNIEKCRCADETLSSSPFAVLSKLRK